MELNVNFDFDCAKEIEDIRKLLEAAHPELKLALNLEEDADEIIRFGWREVHSGELWNTIAALVWADIYPEPLPDDIYPPWTVWKLNWRKNSMKSFYKAIAARLEKRLPDVTGIHMLQLYEDISRGSMLVALKIVHKLTEMYSRYIERGEKASSHALMIVSPFNRAADVCCAQLTFLRYQLINRIYSLRDTMLSGLLKTVIPELRKKNIHKGKEKK